MDSIETINRINTYPLDPESEEPLTSNRLICYNYTEHIPSGYTQCPMQWALINCIENNTYEFSIELIRAMNIQCTNHVVMRISFDETRFSPHSVRYKYRKFFNTVFYEEDEHYQRQANNHNPYNDIYAFSSDADAESGNDNQQTQTQRKKDKKTLKMERYKREQRKRQNSNDTNHVQNSEIPKPPPPIIGSSNNAPPPNLSTSGSLQSSQNSLPLLPPKPQFNFEEKHQHQNQNIQNQQIMPRPILPRFDFDSDKFEFDSDKFEVSDTHSSSEIFWKNHHEFRPPPAPIQSHYNRNRHKPPRVNQYNAMPQPIHSRSKRQKQHQMPQSQKKKERTEPPVLNNIFSIRSTQTHEQYRAFHQECRKTYADKLKAAPKVERNPKNYFLLPVLLHFNHEIGSKIGETDYKFQVDSGLNSQSLKGRDSNKYYGVDFEIAEKNDASNVQKDASNVLQELMQAEKFIINKDYEYKTNNDSSMFGYTFIFRNECIAEGRAKNKKDAKRECSRNVIQTLKSVEPYLSEFASCLNRIELGIKVGKKDDAVPIGYEYEVILSQRGNRRYRYEYMKCDDIRIRLERKDAGYYHENALKIYRDRGVFGNDLMVNPSVENMYIDNWQQRFKGKRNVPTHCHEYLNKNGIFIKEFGDEKEKQLWKAIWRVYRGRYKEGKEKRDIDKEKPAHALQYNIEEKRDYRNDTEYTHVVLYDFDGTVYCSRLYFAVSQDQKRNEEQYINDLIREHGVSDGFGGPQRIEAMKQHFEALRQYKPKLCVALMGFVRVANVEKLFKAINVDIYRWFDVVLDPSHDIVARLIKDGGNFPKNKMMQLLCDQYNVSTKNGIFVDDDKKITQMVECCDVFQAQNRGKGLMIHEFSDISQMIADKLHQKKHHQNRYQQNYQDMHHNQYDEHKHKYQNYNYPQYDHYHNQQNMNNNYQNQQKYAQQNYPMQQNYQQENVKMENCMSCENSFNVNQLKHENGMYFCTPCFNAQQHSWK